GCTGSMQNFRIPMMFSGRSKNDACWSRVKRHQMALNTIARQRFDRHGGAERKLTDLRAPQLREVTADCQYFPEVARDRANVRPAPAVDAKLAVRELIAQQLDRVNLNRAR